MATRVLEGGERLQRHLAEIARKLGRGGTLKVGFLSGSVYPDGTSVAMVAAIHNFGAPSRNIPPRSFFSNMIARHSGEWPSEIRTQLKSTGYDAVVTMNRMGALITGQLQQSIRDTNEPPLRPATIRRKGFDKPLIDTSLMNDSATFEYNER
jgi:hypothetical protein